MLMIQVECRVARAKCKLGTTASNEGPTPITFAKDMWICFLSVGTSEPRRLKLSKVEIKRVSTFKLLLVFGIRKICVGTITSTRRLRRQTRSHTIRETAVKHNYHQMWARVWTLEYTVRIEYARQYRGRLPEYLANEIQGV